MGRLRLASGRQCLVGAFVVLAVLAGASGAVRAAADKREVEARADFAAGRYQQAIDRFAQLYGETLNPIYLRNIGRCQQGLNQPQAAINSFRDYLKKAKAMTADERQEIEGYIKEMETRLAPQPGPPPATTPPVPLPLPPGPPPSTVVPPSPPAEHVSEPGPATAAPPPPPTVALPPVNPPPTNGPVLTVTAPPPPSHLEHPWRTAGIVTAAAGGALVVTGVVLGLSARSDANAVSAQYDRSQADAGKRNGKIAVAADVVGAAAVVTGILLATHAVEIASPPALSLRASASADLHAGLLLLGGTF